MDDFQRQKIEGAVRCCAECFLEERQSLRAKSFKKAWIAAFHSSCLKHERWVAPSPTCALNDCPSSYKTNMVIYGCLPQPWTSYYVYIVWGKGRSAKIGRLIEINDGKHLVMGMSAPKHKNGSRYSRICLNGRIEIVRRNFALFKDWRDARAEFWERGGKF